MEPLPPQAYFVTSIVLLTIGMYCIVSKRNMMKTVIGIEIATMAVNMAFLSLSWMRTYPVQLIDPLAQAFVVMSIVIGGAIAALALSLVVNAHHHYRTLDLKKLRRLRW
ncbi:MAG: NADH-quinone oxidoreductase subunit K [Candidatus Nezhaarchaeota archaeon]|nr:NADH-quinone oxidoreductase subunit K [Candidatus Nezhaarchaeota archaeon]MCX8142231.1 NADH-quinone oxidoreductase subunit K [Candidatus Nezhaarchaeota archaeon]MDW8050796.1 NADH-quinone oxidoreductase subunit K [Nitrososphaerota archaeon]